LINTTDIRSYNCKIGIGVVGLGKIIPAIGDLYRGHTGPDNILIGVLKAIGKVRCRGGVGNKCPWLRNKQIIRTIGWFTSITIGWFANSRCISIDQVGTELTVYIYNPFSQVCGVHNLIEAL